MTGQNAAHAAAVSVAVILLLWGATGWTAGFTTAYLLYLWMLWDRRRPPRP